MTATNNEVLFAHRTYVDAAEGKLIGAIRAIGRTSGNAYIELHIESLTGEVLAINMPEGFNPPVHLVRNKSYKMAWVADEDGFKRLHIEELVTA